MPAKSAAPTQTEVLIDPLLWLLIALVSGLTFMRWWQPTEGAFQGDTLSIVLGWFAALALLGWIGFRGTKWGLKRDLLQCSLGLLVGGHVLSGLLVLATSGDQRAALNLIWEWGAIGISAPLLRIALGSPTARREWTVVALAAVVTLSGYALFQRAYVYPQTIAEYQKVRTQLDEVERRIRESPRQIITPELQGQLQRYQTLLLRQGLQPQMLTGASRKTFEARLLHSHEVLGRFALANTLAGLLLVWWVVLIIHAVTAIRWLLATSQPVPGPPVDLGGSHNSVPVSVPKSGPLSGPGAASKISRTLALLVLAGIVGYCLLLTKSRTAFVAAFVSLTAWMLLASFKSQATGRRLLLWAMVGFAGLGILITLASFTGGLDRYILSEAPKSLQYRLEYWWSSLQVIKEAPLLGVGPGQFRQHYLVHKLPRSSEEIADPHNLFLDVWANGGLLALLGLLGLIVSLLQIGFRLPFLSGRDGMQSSSPKFPADDSTPSTSPAVINIAPAVRDVRAMTGSVKKVSPPTPQRKRSEKPQMSGIPELSVLDWSSWSSPIRLGALGGLALLWFSEGNDPLTLGCLIAGWVVGIMVLGRFLPEVESRNCWVAAGCGLVVHLLGAGGIAMPAIGQLLVVVAILCQPADSVLSVSQERANPQLDQQVGNPPRSGPPAGAGEAPGLTESLTGDSIRRSVEIDARSERSYRTIEFDRSGSLWIVILAMILFGACYLTAAKPVWLCQSDLDQADYTNSFPKRQQYLRQASQHDSLNPLPLERLASESFQKWRLAQNSDERDFQAAIAAQESAIHRNPHGYQEYRNLAEFHLERLRRKQQPTDREAAVKAMRQAIQLYPHHAELSATAAETFYQCGEPELAKTLATAAIEQDDVNHSGQHSDKYLSDDLRRRMQEIQTTPQIPGKLQ